MDCFFIIDKPAGITSHDVVNVIRKLTKLKKVGHAGTLDPLATGVLVVAVGRATRLLQFLQSDAKEYQGEMQLGIVTDTFDLTGEVLSKKPVSVTEEQIIKAFGQLEGEVKQTPPQVSAIKVEGVPLYKLARQGKKVKPPARIVRIDRFECLSFKPGSNSTVSFKVKCSKGTYVRSLCQEVGEILGCGASLTKLRRLSSGRFSLKDAATLEELEKLEEEGNLEEALIPPAVALSDFPFVTIKKDFKKSVLNGQLLTLQMIEKEPPRIDKGFLCLVDSENNLLAVAKKVNYHKAVAKPICVVGG